ncbi:MAG: M48 family metallopeptidase [Oscillospiraceae bacterium]|nr:M48 family metallopeptidase [Oscillospiraceae bacterium]
MSLRLDREGNAIVRAPSGVKQDVIDRFVAAHEDWILRAREKQALHRAAHPEPAEEERAALLARAKEYLPVRVAYWSDVMGLTPAGVKITSARTRFGSCSGKNSLCFSWRLMQYPPSAIDYVVVHELAHIRHHDHSAAFYALVERYLPDWRARMKLLKE